jgi:MFS family permease
MPLNPMILVVGAAMLIFGRRLFWVFVAGTGFIVGALLTAHFLQGHTQPWILQVAAVACGIAGAVLAVVAQKIAAGVGGALAGAYLSHAIALATGGADKAWLAFLVGGIVGAMLLLLLFDWALIALSSLTGAVVLAQHLPAPFPWPAVAFVFFLAFGLAIQSRQLRKPAAPSKAAEE